MIEIIEIEIGMVVVTVEKRIEIGNVAAIMKKNVTVTNAVVLKIIHIEVVRTEATAIGKL